MLLKINEATSSKIKNMSLICMFLVVVQHMPFSKDIEWFSRFLTDAAVPWFFVVSGMFFGRGADECGWYSRALKKRVATLLTPFAIFNFAWYCFCVRHTISRFDIVDALGVNFFSLPTNSPLWYIRALFLFCLISPVFVRVVRSSGRWRCVCGFCLVLAAVYMQVLCNVLQDEPLVAFLRWGVPIDCLMWFVFGIAIGMGRIKIRLSGVARCVSLCAICACCQMVKCGNLVADSCLKFVGIICVLLVLWLVIPVGKHFAVVRENLFPIYVLHYPIAVLAGAMLTKVNGNYLHICRGGG